MTSDDFEPFVAFVQDDTEAPAWIPDRAENVLHPESDSLFEILQQKIVDEDDETTLIAPASSSEGPTSKARPPERASNDTVESKTPEALQEQLEPFEELNSREKKVPWKERYEVVKTQFPSVQSLDWEKVFRSDPTIMGNILNDIIKVQVAPKGRPGKRPALDKEQARDILKQYQGEDYTLLPFPKAVTRLKQQQSVRQFARKVSMSPTYAYKLMTGAKPPTVEDMELVAEAYGKDPSFFYEYRVAFIATLMVERVDYAPEASIIYYERAMQARKRA